MSKAVAASLAPPTPSNQMTIAAPMASRMAITASTSAPASVDSAGTISSAPERTMMTAIKVAASENKATRRAQTASRDGGSSMVRRRTITCQLSLLSAPGGRSAGRQRRANLFQRRPIRGAEQWRRGARGGNRVDRDDAFLGVRMIGQDFDAFLLVDHDARQDGGERARIAADLAHQDDAID